MLTAGHREDCYWVAELHQDPEPGALAVSQLDTNVCRKPHIRCNCAHQAPWQIPSKESDRNLGLAELLMVRFAIRLGISNRRGDRTRSCLQAVIHLGVGFVV